MAPAPKDHCARWRARVTLALMAAVLPVRAQTAAQIGPYQVEAAFLLNFTKFIEWPPAVFDDAASPFEICVWGEDPFGSALDEAVRGEAVVGHRMVVRHIKRALEMKPCQILFVGDGERNVSATLSEVGPGILTVSNRPEFLREGGIIAFVLEGRHVRFDVNQRAASKESLIISARLLNVARTVQK
jgi:hypothetical protein